jgi:hypothetical protein
MVHDETRYGIYLLENGNWNTIADPVASAAIRASEPNQLAVSAEGEKIVFLANDIVLGDMDDSQYRRHGWIGLAVQLSSAGDPAVINFDNVQLRTPHANQQLSIESGRQLAQNGEIEEALEIYGDVADGDTGYAITAYSWNALCWFGSLWGKPEAVMEACNTAVQVAHETDRDYVDYCRGSRGIARALTGDYDGAIEDLQFYGGSQEQGTERAAWIAELEAGRNPFDEATLATLRGE